MSTYTAGRFGVFALSAIAATGCQKGGEISGIDGTGVRTPVAAAAYGRVETAGTFVVNGVTYDTSKMAVTVDGAPGTIYDIATGDVVFVTGTIDSTSASTGIAERAVLEHAVVGPVDSVDTANQLVRVLGQPVSLEEAVFDSSIPQASIVGLAVGDVVEVSGFRDQETRVIASRIAKRAAAAQGFRAEGRVANLDPAAKRFALHSLTVDYAGAAVAPGPSGSLAPGDFVAVSGASIAPDGALLAEQVVFDPTDVVASPGTYVNLEGYVTALDLENPETFEVAGLPVRTTSETEKDGALGYGIKTEVKGELTTSGTLTASNVRTRFPVPAGAHTLTGLVFDAYTGPVANTVVDVWIELGKRSGFSWTFATGNMFHTDDAGRFQITGLPTARVKLWVGAYMQGYMQPCAVSIDMTRDTSRDIEVVRVETLNSVAPPRPITAREPTLAGTVYEMTSTGRQPLVGAYIEIDGAGGLGLPLANTLTDLKGNYFLCDLDPDMDLIVWEENGSGGYSLLKQIHPVGGSPSTTLDIEIERQ